MSFTKMYSFTIAFSIIIFYTMKISANDVTIEEFAATKDKLFNVHLAWKLNPNDKLYYIDANFSVPFDIHHNTLAQGFVYFYSMNKWIQLIKTKQIDTCTYVKRYLGNIWNDFRRSANYASWSPCVFAKGKYQARDLLIDANRVGVLLPKGRLKLEFRMALAMTNEEVLIIQIMGAHN